tara:strand:+ start:266 stop:1999 length:1734 start_codon:yes stop_codon:yes gene_type:complete
VKRLVIIPLLFSIVWSEPIDLSLEWVTNENLFFSEELESVIEEEISDLYNILGIIVIYKGQVVSEHYYNNSYQDDVFNIWSVTKSYISTLIGQAIDMGMMYDPDSLAYHFFPEYDIEYLEDITLHNLLSMSSGYGESWPYLDQTTEDLLSMDHSSPGEFNYNNSACHLNSHALYYETAMRPNEFANNHLFPYLGIVDPYWTDGYLGINDGSINLFLTLREMVKLGQLYIQDGFSGNEQILSSEWIERATSPQVETNWGNNGYGYLWWLTDIGSSYQAYGLGGQYITVFPDYDLVIGTRSNWWGPGDINVHTYWLQYAIFERIAPLFDRPSIVINEILALNNGCCQDEHEDQDAYIELYNHGNDTVDVAGFFLTNDIGNSENYVQIPTASDATLIAPDEFLLLWTDDSEEQGILHIDAILSATGGDLALYMQDTVTAVDIINYSIQAPDMAFAREEDGLDSWVYMNPTPGLSNTTIMNIEENKLNPISFKLSQNYPNPFNPTTTINYELLNDSKVNIKVFDISGRVVKELINDHHNIGKYAIQWNAVDGDGQKVSAGLYFYSISTEYLTETKKMILLK